jgi:hypothetical protein
MAFNLKLHNRYWNLSTHYIINEINFIAYSITNIVHAKGHFYKLNIQIIIRNIEL